MGSGDGMPDLDPAAARVRQRRAEQSANGWAYSAHCDGIGGDGLPTYWDEWLHRDGRRAIQWANGSCSDPELEAALRAMSEDRPGQIPPWKLTLARAIAKLLHAARRARQGRPPT